MFDSNLCRLCFSTNNDCHLNIFSVIGVKLKMSEIISEHFKCEISEVDSLPNSVCQACWQTTEAFHDLFQKSKIAQETFLNPMVKIEVDTSLVWHENTERDFSEGSQIDIDEVKIEPDSDVLNSQDNCNEVDDLSDRDASNYNNDDPISSDVKACSNTRRQSKPLTKRITMKERELEFNKLFSENKYRFDMACDNCPVSFESLDDARLHYAKKHNDPKGYIKCCEKKLTYRFEVVKHLYRHLEPDKFKCNECNKVYHAEHALKGHIKIHHTKQIKKERLICDICKKTFISKVGLKNHLQWHSEAKTDDDDQYKKFIAENFDMSCDNCEAVFNTFHESRQHYKAAHNDDNGYIKCCNIKFRKLWIVKDHVKSHLHPDCFKCDICNKSFSSRMVLVQHKRQHKLTMQKSFICDFCGNSFRNKDLITRHIFSKHVNSEPKFECNICHKKFQLEKLLKNHTYAVHREKKHSITCEICGKSFYTKFHLGKHMLSHTDKSERLKQREQCEYCGEWLWTKSGIHYHKQLHTSGIQKCPHCQMELANKNALLGHIRRNHREHKYKCSFCDKTFVIASTMREHEESHTRHKVYQCKYCPQSFSVSSSRRTHTRRNHQEQIKRITNNRMS